MATNGSKLLAFTTLILWLALITARETRAAAARPLRIAFLFTSGTMASLWMAKESGAFAKEGLEVEIDFHGFDSRSAGAACQRS